MFDSLRVRLMLIFIGLAIGPIIIVGAATGQRSFANLNQQSQALQRQIVESVSDEIGAFISERENELVRLDNVIGLGARPLKEQRAILSNVLLQQQVYQEIALLDSQGQEQIRLSRTDTILEDDLDSRAGDEEFLVPATRGQTYFSPARFDETIREPLLTISVPLFNRRSGAMISVLVADLRFKPIWNMLADFRLPGEGDAYLVDRSGRVVAHKNPAVVLRGTTINLAEVGGRTEGLFGRDVVIAKDVLRFGNQELVVVAEQPLSEVLGLALSNLHLTVVITTVVLMVAVVLVVLITRSIVRPIESLAASAQAISRGDFSKYVEVSSRGEIRTLANAFNTMSGQLRHTLTGLEQEIADRKKAEAKLRTYSETLEATVKQLETAQEKLVRQERLAAIGQISGSIAHELRNPLGSIKQSGFFLKRLHHKGSLTPTNPKVGEHLDLIEAEVHEANRVITDLLEMSRMKVPMQEVVDLHRIILEATDRSHLPDQTHLQLDLRPDPFLIWVDPLQLRQVLINLLTNARQACQKQGLIKVLGRIIKKTDQVQIQVSDNGCGIHADAIDKVFEPLYTNKAKGTGLGLSICKQIIEAHSGKITLCSQINQGTTVEILLPYQPGG
jgi:signal transduction histidine kinase